MGFVSFLPKNFASYVSLLRWRAEEQAQRQAYTFLKDGEIAERDFTYATLDERARALAARLQQMGARGERVLLFLDSDLNYVASFLGCLYAGAIAVTLHPPARPKHLSRIRRVAEDAEAKFALTTRSLYDTFGEHLSDTPRLKDLAWVQVDRVALDEAAQWQAYEPHRDDLAFLQYTSGSTSMPKGVMVSHANLLHQGRYMQTSMQLTPQDCAVTWLPHFHDMGLILGVLQPLYTGYPCYVMTPNSFLKRPLRWLKAISQYRATLSYGPNFSYDLCIDSFDEAACRGLDLSCWEIALNGAEPLRVSSLEKFTATYQPFGFRANTFLPAYGMAETTLKVSGKERGKPLVTLRADTDLLQQNRVVPVSNEARGQDLISCGRAYLDTEICIAQPDTLAVCTPFEVGEIFVKGELNARGYWNNPEATERTFNVTIADAGPYLRTGDLGFLDANGELYITGRAKDLIIIRGENHYPQDIEQTVERTHPAIRPTFVAAFSIEHNDAEQLVVVAEINKSDIRTFVAADAAQAVFRNIAATHQVQPYEIVFVRTGVPKTTSGKLQRQEAKSLYLAGELESIARVRNPLFA